MNKRQNPWNNDKPLTYDGMWVGTTTCQKSINRKISGNEGIGWLPYALDRYFPADRANVRCLVLGCSEGWVIEHLLRTGFTGEIVATDIADKALARTRERLREFGNVRYVPADLNTYKFEGRFNLIIAEGVLHHIENVRGCARHLHDVLAPEGLLVGVEFEGAFRFQLPEAQIRWINAALNILPKGLRGGFSEDPETSLPATVNDMARVFYPRQSPESVEAADPSEAIAGHLLGKVIADTFRIIERKPYSGTLLSYMTGHFPFSRANQDPVIDAWLEVLVHIEETITSTGLLPDEFVFYVLGRK